MGLTSELFAGDTRIEAIAVSDASNVKFGDSGPHVSKIQRALNTIEGTGLSEDGAYGSLTQQAVLNFKRKRNIINPAYQTTPDAIVGKMTIVALDRELYQRQSAGPMTLRVVSHPRSPADDYRETRPNSSSSPMLSFAISQSLLNSVTPLAVPIQMNNGLTVATNATVDIGAGGSALIEIKGGMGAGVYLPWRFSKVRDPKTKQDIGSISDDPQTVEIFGTSPGSMFVAFSRRRPVPFNDDVVLLPVVVRNPAAPQTVYKPTMTPHNHLPTPKWNEVCDKIDQPGFLEAGLQGTALGTLCKSRAAPETFASMARTYLVNRGAGGAGVAHFDWYLRGGGADFIEDGNIASWVQRDKKLRDMVAAFVRQNMARVRHSDEIFFPQDGYDSIDHCYAFGTIDRLFIAFDLIARYVKIWFKDRYEWHPYCPPYYSDLAGDKRDGKVRHDNSLHAAMVQMKYKGAADFWMIGEATRPMSDFGL